jgi:hypothetical protein
MLTNKWLIVIGFFLSVAIVYGTALLFMVVSW